MKVSKKMLKKLYWKKKKSLTEIAKIFKVHPETIRRWMKNFNIPRRSISEALFLKKGIKPPLKKKLFNLYWKQRKSTSQIATQLGVCKFTVRKWLKKYNIPLRSSAEGRRIYARNQFSRDENERWYMIGFCKGDLYVRKHGQTIEVGSSSTHPAFIKLFEKLFTKYGYCSIVPGKNKLSYQWKLRCALDLSFEFLLENKFIVPRKFFFPFLAGYFDAEGYLKVFKTSCNGIGFELRISSRDLDILQQIKQRLEEEGYNPTLRKERSGIYCLGLYRRVEILSLIKKLLRFSKHSEKIRMMQLILEIQNKKKWKEVEHKLKQLKSNIRKEVRECVKKAKKDWELRHKKQK